MKKIMWIVFTFLVTSGAAARSAGLSTTWSLCAGNGGTNDVTFDCTPGNATVYELFSTFTLDDPVPGVVEARAVVDLIFPEASAVPPWWQFSSGGCNEGSLRFDYLRPRGICSSASALLCGSSPEACSGSGVTGIGYGVGGPNRARVLILVARPPTSPVTLPPGRHFAWSLRFPIDPPPGLGPCAGCDAPVTIVFQQLDLRDDHDVTTTVMGAAGVCDPNAACANHFACGCDVPVRPKTWGRLKVLYR